MMRRHTLVILLLLPLVSGTVWGTTLARMTVEQMAAASPLVARVRCLGNATGWEQGEIWTVTSFEVLEVWKGSAPQQISVRLIGGRSGHLISSVAGVPRFERGEETILFLVPTPEGEFTVTSWMQGTFRIRYDPRAGTERVTQDTAGVAVFDPRTRRFEPSGIRDLPLDRLRDRIAATIKASGSNP